MLDGFLKTTQHALHWLRTNPRFVIPAVLSLALGFGGATVMFSVMYYALFPKIPYRQPERIVTMRMMQTRDNSMGPPTTSDFNDWKAQNTVFESMGMFLPGAQQMTITGGGYPDRVRYQYATAAMFPLLGVRPQLGVTFDVKRASNAAAVILSDEFWRRRFNADPKIVGSRVRLAGVNHDVIGVMPPGFHIANIETDLWRETNTTGVLNDRKVRWLLGAGVLKPGVTIEQAQASMDALVKRLEEIYPDTNKGWKVLLQPLAEYGNIYRAQTLVPFVGAVAFVLLIACTNVTGLLVAHAAGRRRELATRVALGASRGRLVRQLMAESVALALVSAIVGVLLARWWFGILMATVPRQYGFINRSSFDLPVFLFVLGVSLLAGLIMGFVVAWKSSAPDVNGTLKQNAGGVTSGTRQRALSVLAAAEIALAFTLIVGAGLLMRTVANREDRQVGYNADNVLTAEIDLTGPKYRGRTFRRDMAIVTILPSVSQFYERLVEDLRRLPTVEAAGLASWVPAMPPGSGRRPRTFIIGDQPDPGPGGRPSVAYNAVTPGFFEALKIRLLRGRLLSDRDTFDTPWVAVINEAMAKKYWPDTDPLGKTLTIDIIAEEQPRQIVGVVANARDLTSTELYVSLFQEPELYPGDGAQNRFRKGIVIRGQPSPSLVTGLRNAVARIDPELPVFQVRTLREWHTLREAPARFQAALTSVVAIIGLFLAALGIFALVSHAAADRSQEFGIRMALGATSGMLLRSLVIWSAKVAGVGLVLGILLAAWQTRFLQSLLVGVTPLDVPTFVVAALVVALVALLAALQSARRVRRVDTVTVLRG